MVSLDKKFAMPYDVWEGQHFRRKGGTVSAATGLSESLGDYLESIYHLVRSRSAALVKEIAERMKVQKSSVTGALRLLAEKGLVNYDPYSFVTLTARGERIARDLVRRHETLRQFLTRVLAVEAAAADRNACHMEHAIEPQVLEKLYELGREIARRGNVLITGACPGLPHEAAKGAAAEGGTVIGISPALNLRQHVEEYESPTRGYDAIIYTGSGLMGREIENIRSCDVVILAGGRSGTLGEFAIAYDEGKIIGVLMGTGGITEHLHDIIKMVKKKTGAQVLYGTEPGELMDKLEKVYWRKLHPQYTALMQTHDPDGVVEE
jgi:uncharacterized protein (TIGR00725 family)